MDEAYLFDPAILKEIKLSDWPKTAFPDSVTLTSPGEGLLVRPLKRDDFERGKMLAQIFVFVFIEGMLI